MKQLTQRGALVLETALILPVVFGLIFGLFEIGSYIHTVDLASTAVGNATRTAQAAGQDIPADYEILSSLKASLAEVHSADILCVVIYHAASLSDTVNGDDCSAPVCPKECTAYDSATMASLNEGEFTSAAPIDSAWLPSQRNVSRQCNTTYLGVYLRLRYTSPTGMYSFPGAITRSSVISLDAVTDQDQVPSPVAC